MEQKTENILKRIGLSKQESRVYISLLEMEESQTGQLCSKTDIASSNIYKILEGLMKKGLVNYRVQNNVKIFMPSQPDSLNEIFIAKQKELENERKEIRELISNLKRAQPEKEPYSNYKYFEGVLGIKSMWHEINQKMNPKHLIKIHTAKRESYEKFVDFYDLHHKIRKEKKIKEQLIFPNEDKELAKKRSSNNTEIRFLSLENDAEWGVFDDYYFIQYITGKNPRAFLIKDKVFADTMGKNFDLMWKIAKK